MPIAEHAPELHHDKPWRSEAIRRLIEFALAVKAKRQNAGNKWPPRVCYSTLAIEKRAPFGVGDSTTF
jgi:hypothetical protein